MAIQSDEVESTKLIRALPTGEPSGALVTFSSVNLLVEYAYAELLRSPTGSLTARPLVGSLVFEGAYAVRFRDDHCYDRAIRFPGIREAELVEVVNSHWILGISAQVSPRERSLLAGAHHFAVVFGEFGLLEVISDRVRFDGVRSGYLPVPGAIESSDAQCSGNSGTEDDYLC